MTSQPLTTPHRLALRGGRRWPDRIMVAALGLSVLMIVAILAVIIGNIAIHGLRQVTWEFVSQPPRDGLTSGGIYPAIIGTAVLVILITIAAVSLGVASAD